MPYAVLGVWAAVVDLKVGETIDAKSDTVPAALRKPVFQLRSLLTCDRDQAKLRFLDVAYDCCEGRNCRCC